MVFTQKQFNELFAEASRINQQYQLDEDKSIIIRRIDVNTIEIEHFISKLTYHVFDIAMNRLHFIEQFSC